MAMTAAAVAKDVAEHSENGNNSNLHSLEMETLVPPSPSRNKGNNGGASLLSKRINHFMSLIKLCLDHYPKLTLAVSGFIGLLLIKTMFFRHRGETLYVPPHLMNHHGDLVSYYDLQLAKIDHWCLKGGNDDCHCDDPTDALSREDVYGWLETFRENKKLVEAATSNRNNVLDVVFYGDETTQAWTGKTMNRATFAGTRISQQFNETFRKENGAIFEGLALGIAGDSVSLLCVLGFAIQL
jgi:hypothetical protein